MRLRLRVRPKKGEDVVGLALRLTQRGNYADLKSFLRVHNLHLGTDFFDIGLNKIAELADLPIDPLLEWSVKPVTPTLSVFRSEQLPKQNGLLPSYRRFCPLCLRRDFEDAPSDEPEASIPFIRSWWYTTLIYACPVHRTAMLDRCPKCNQHISGQSLPIHQCPCGQDLRHGISVDLSPGDLTANDYFLGRLSLADPLICPMLDKIPLCDVANVLRRLGAAALLGKRDHIKVSVGQLDKDLASNQAPVSFGRLLNNGFEYARGGSPSLLKLMERMVEGDQRVYAGPAELLGTKFRNWAVHRENPIRDCILEVWDPFIEKHCQRTRRTNKPHGPRPAHLAAYPQQLHALERERFSRLLGYALPDHFSRKEALALGKRKELISTKKELLGSFNWDLGSSFNRIVQSGFFTPSWYADVTHVQPFYIFEITAFLERVNKQSRGNSSGIRQILLNTAIVKGKDKAVPVLLSRILRGDLPLFGSHSGGFLSSFTIPWDEAPKGEVVDVGHIDAAFVLGINVETVGQLAFHGHLQNGDDSASIHIQSLDNFARSYITAARLGAICSSAMHTESIEKLLVDAGVQRVLPPNSQMIFPREAAVRAFYQNWSWDLEPLRATLDITAFVRAA